MYIYSLYIQCEPLFYFSVHPSKIFTTVEFVKWYDKNFEGVPEITLGKFEEEMCSELGEDEYEKLLEFPRKFNEFFFKWLKDKKYSVQKICKENLFDISREKVICPKRINWNDVKIV